MKNLLLILFFCISCYGNTEKQMENVILDRDSMLYIIYDNDKMDVKRMFSA